MAEQDAASEICQCLDDIFIGIEKDLYVVQASRYVIDTLAGWSKRIHGAGRNFFAFAQLVCNRTYMLHLHRLFETPGKRYPLRSVPALLDLLEAERAQIPIVNPDHLRKRLGIPESEQGDANLTGKAVEHYRRIFSGPPTAALRARLAALRDKALAHHEAIDIASLEGLPMWPPELDFEQMGTDGAEDALHEFVEVIGATYLSSHSDIRLDAGKVQRSLEAALRAMYPEAQ